MAQPLRSLDQLRKKIQHQLNKESVKKPSSEPWLKAPCADVTVIRLTWMVQDVKDAKLQLQGYHWMGAAVSGVYDWDRLQEQIRSWALSREQQFVDTLEYRKPHGIDGGELKKAAVRGVKISCNDQDGPMLCLRQVPGTQGFELPTETFGEPINTNMNSAGFFPMATSLRFFDYLMQTRIDTHIPKEFCSHWEQQINQWVEGGADSLLMALQDQAQVCMGLGIHPITGAGYFANVLTAQMPSIEAYAQKAGLEQLIAHPKACLLEPKSGRMHL